MASDPLDRYLNHRSSMLERRASMRPMGSMEIIDFSLRMYQTLGWTILKATALPAAFTFAGLAFFFEIVFPRFTVTRNPESVPTQVSEGVVTMLIGLGIAAPISMIGFSLTSTMIVKLVANYVEGAVPDAKAAGTAARVAFWPMFKLTMFETFVATITILGSTLLLMLSAYLDSQSSSNAAMAGLVSGLGVVGIAIGFLVLLVVVSFHALTGPIVVLEGKGAREASRRSRELLKGLYGHPSGHGTTWACFCLLGMLALILLPSFYAIIDVVDLKGIVSSASGIPVLGASLGMALQQIPLFLMIWVGAPVWCTTIAVLYFERRIRMEGFDIETLARDMVRHRKENRFEL